jgi:beta-barrel assembly-enhancing protease
MSMIETKKFSRRAMLGMLGTGAGWIAAGALRAAEPHITVPPYNNLSDEEEIALGQKFAAKLESEVQIVYNPIVDRYLNGIVQNLAKVSQRPNLPYRVKLVNTMTINASSIPGGNIYLYRGLVHIMESEDEMVAALSHEVGHIVGRHVTNRLLLSFQARKVYEAVRQNLFKNNQVVGQIIDRLGGAVAMLALLHFGREDEYQADMLGFYEMLRAHYQPKGFLKFFAQVEELERKSGSHPNPYLVDHPPTHDRYERIEHELTQVQVPARTHEDSLEFHAFRAALNLLPAPPKQG